MRSDEKLMDSLGDAERNQLAMIVGNATAIGFYEQDGSILIDISGFRGAKELIKQESGECGHYAEVLYYEQLVHMLEALVAHVTTRLVKSRRRFIASDCDQRDVLRRKQEEYRRRQFRGRVQSDMASNMPYNMPSELQRLVEMAKGAGLDTAVVEVSKDHVAKIFGSAFREVLDDLAKEAKLKGNPERKPQLFEDEDKTDEVEYEDSDTADSCIGESLTLNDFEDTAPTIDLPEQRKPKD